IMRLGVYGRRRPVGIQIFGANLDRRLRTLGSVAKSNPDNIGINLGCPGKNEVRKGPGAGMLKDVCLVEQPSAELVKRTNITITVKTRLGRDHDSIRIVEVA